MDGWARREGWKVERRRVASWNLAEVMAL